MLSYNNHVGDGGFWALSTRQTSLAHHSTRQTSLAHHSTRQTSLAHHSTRQRSLAHHSTRQRSLAHHSTRQTSLAHHSTRQTSLAHHIGTGVETYGATIPKPMRNLWAHTVHRSMLRYRCYFIEMLQCKCVEGKAGTLASKSPGYESCLCT
uniref:Uncharacterized protein n=1 Tax=Balaenoptera musculus TaxID=9771 RepID=A0A8C0DBR1_BALMU